MDDDLQRDLAGMRAAQAAVQARVADLDDVQARAPSRLPGWTVGHLVTHLSRYADSVSRRLEAATRGEVVDQYAGGAEGRAVEIEDGARRPAVELHHVDLGLGYEPDDWPIAFVTRILPFALADVGHRLPGLESVDPRVVVAWSFGRSEPPAGLPVLRPF